MYILDSCNQIELLKVILFIKEIIKVAFIIIPIILILLVLFDLFKVVAYNGNYKTKNMESLMDDMGKGSKMAIKRVLTAIILFFVPSIVNISMGLLEISDISIDYVTCYNKAEKAYIDSYQLIVDQQEKIKEEEEKARMLERMQNIPNNDNKLQKYYFNATEVSAVKRELMAFAAEQIGNSNDASVDYKYTFGGSNWEEKDWGWCAAFVTYCLVETEKLTNYDIPFNFEARGGKLHWQSVLGYGMAFGYYSFNDDYVTNDDSYFAFSEHVSSKCGYGEQNNTKIEKSGNYIPNTGDIIVFAWSDAFEKSCHYIDLNHIGLVESVDKEAGTVTYIHGNTSGCCNQPSCVCRNTRYLNDKNIGGYGVWK